MTDDDLFEAVRARVRAGRPTDHDSTLPTPAPASRDMVEAVERDIGFPLPPLVRRIYLEIADGGVGPFSGFSPLDDDGWRMPGPPPDRDEAELAQYPADPPLGVVFFCDFGCAMWALLDCRHPEGQMWWWQEGDRHKLDLTFPQWLQAWLDGHLTHEYREERDQP